MKVYILSGGKSSRMGEDKGLKFLSGKPVIYYLLETLFKLNLEIVIIAHNEAYKQFGVPVIADLIKEKGPLGGIYTALSHAHENVLILSADTPFLTSESITFLLDNIVDGKINIIKSHGKKQSLFASYPFILKDKIENRILKNKLKLMNFLEETEINEIILNLSLKELININTLEDFITAEKLLSNEN